MSRPTYKLSITDDDIKGLETIKSNSVPGSITHKRCSVVLDCGSGSSGKEIAARYGITPNMVINWRRRYEKGGVDGLLKNAPKPGRPGCDGVALSARVSAALQQDKSPDGKSWSSASLASYLNAPRSSIQRALKQLNINLSRRHQWDFELSSELKKMRAEMAGLYLRADLQVLVLASSPKELNTCLSDGVMVTVNGKAARCLEVAEKRGATPSLSQALTSLSELSQRQQGVRSAPEADTWLGTLEDQLRGSGFTLYVLIHAAEPKTITQGLKVRTLMAPDTTAWLKSAEGWLNLLDPEGDRAPAILTGMQRWIATAADDSEPFIWQVHGDRAAQGAQANSNASAEPVTPAQGNVLKVSLEYLDAEGQRLICTQEFNNVVPLMSAYGQAPNRAQYAGLVGQLEQGALKSTQQVVRAFMSTSLQMPKSLPAAAAAHTSADAAVKKKKRPDG